MLTCVTSERFGPVLEAIKASGITTGKALLEAVPPREPLDWLSLVLLLDQVPRNCYRGDAAVVAYTVFDPLAQQVTLAAMEQGIPDVLPEFRWSFARRMWFYLPLMHSEDPAEHDLATTKYASLQADMLSLIPGEASANLEAENEHHREALRVVRAKADAAKMLGQVQVDFEKKHYDIIKQFGRYPHRNKTMGREMTAAEQEYLDNGGETFSG
jgi:uncharacterized protein (DUF924 family)